MIAVVFANKDLMSDEAAKAAVRLLQYWGVPFAVREDEAADPLLPFIPAEATWVVCARLEDVRRAHAVGAKAIIAKSVATEAAKDDIVISSLDQLGEALSPHYARANLMMRHFIESFAPEGEGFKPEPATEGEA